MTDLERAQAVADLQDIARLASDGARASRERRREMMLEDIREARTTLAADIERLDALWDDIVIAVAELDFII